MKVPINWLKEIVDLPKDIKSLTDNLTMVGHMLDKVEVKNGETILDLELRGNRADCYSMLGIAREVSAIYGNKIKPLRSVSVTTTNKEGRIKLKVSTPLVKRVGMIEINNIVITSSPKWLKEKLENYGMESINNIVDLTNFVMLETGEPMHAFDIDKLKGIEIRLAKKGEEIETFHGEKVKLTENDLVWADGKDLLSIAGAVGEKHHSISANTKNILVEAANYERSSIRRTVYRHKLFTEAGIRHEKDLDPNMVIPAIERFLYFIKKYKWGDFKTVAFDYYPKKIKSWMINLDINQLNDLTGVIFDKKIVNEILKKLNFGSLDNIQIPTYRTDVTLPEDLIEEIVRIYGYDKIPVKTLALSIPTNITPNFITQENEVRNSMVAIGFDEIISLSFISEKYKDKNITLENPPSPENKYMRNSLLPNLYESAKKIIDERGEKVQLFELGKVYLLKSSTYEEKRKLGLIYWDKKSLNFSKYKSKILSLFEKIGLNNIQFSSSILTGEISNSYNITLGKSVIGYGGTYKNLFYTEIDLDQILDMNTKYVANLWPKYPPQIEDITLIIPQKTYIGEVVNEIFATSKIIKKIDLISVYENSHSFRIEYSDKNKTLTDNEVESLRNKFVAKLKSKFGINLKN